MIRHGAGVARTDAQRFAIDDPVLVVLQLHGKVVNAESVRPCVWVDPGAKRRIEGAQGPVIEKTEEIT